MRNQNIKTKVVLFLLIVCFTISTVMGWIGYQNGKTAIKNLGFNQLTSIRATKSSQLQSYLDLVGAQIITLGENPTTIEAMKGFSQAFSELKNEPNQTELTSTLVASDSSLHAYYENEFLPSLESGSHKSQVLTQFLPNSFTAAYLQHHYISENQFPTGRKNALRQANDGSQYSKVHNAFHNTLNSYLEKFDFYDIFLVDHNTGDIVYSVFKEADFATNLRNGPYRRSNIASAYEEANVLALADAPIFVEFDYYAPSYGAPAAFIAKPIFDNGERIGVLIFQMPITRINQIMTGNQHWVKDGLGETGETYLVGPDFTMRSVSRFLVEDREGYFAALEKLDYPSKTISQLDEFDTSILLQRVQTKASFGALSGKSSTGIIEDYRGISVLSSYGPIQFGDHQWALISEIDEAEAFAPIDALARTLIISSLLIGALVVGLAAYFSSQFTKPIISLANAARKVGEGASNISLEVKSTDEIGSLTSSFNDMVENLDSQRRTIEIKNLENTRLLLNILPEPIAERLKSGEAQIADTFSSVSVIFTDLVGFTKWSKGRPPMEVLSMLDDLFGSFDAVASKLGVEKIKTIGDAYMAVCGLPVPNENHASVMAELSFGILDCLEDFNRRNNTELRMRIGIHCGAVVAGVIGTSKFTYDLWGETVNMASRMESTGVPNQIQISQAFYEALNGEYTTTYRGEIEVKGAGMVNTYLLETQTISQQENNIPV